MKQIFIDVETTGVNHWQHSVHQISGGIYIDNILMETFDLKVKPHEKSIIDPEALKIGNLTLQQINSYPHRKEAYNSLIKSLSKYVSRYDKNDKFFFCAYNSHFDNAFMRAFFKQNNDDFFGSFFWSSTIDVMVLAAEKLKNVRHQMPNFQLMTVAKHLGIEVEEDKAHDGYYDITITKKLYDKLIN
jgi:DNA polymerase-3 subunit epsilon